MTARRKHNDGTAAEREEMEALGRRVRRALHSLDDVATGRFPVGVEARGGKDVAEARARGMHVETVGGVTLFARDRHAAFPMRTYLELGGTYGTPTFSRLLGYTDRERADYDRFLALRDQIAPLPKRNDAPHAMPTSLDAFANADEVEHDAWRYPSLRPQVDDIVRRLLAAGAVAPLTYLGAGGYGFVVCDARGMGYKAAREADAFNIRSLADEAAWLRIANSEPAIREHVARFVRWHPAEGVIERECVRAKKSDLVRTWKRGDKLWKLHKLVGRTMLRYGWSEPEFKEDSWVHTRDRGYVLVDAGMALRTGVNLAHEVAGLHRAGSAASSFDREMGRGSLRAEMDRTLPRAAAMRLHDRLAASALAKPNARRAGARGALPPPPPCDFRRYRALPDDPARGSPLDQYGHLHAWRLGNAWTVPVRVPLDELACLRPSVATKGRLADVRRARTTGLALPPIELGVYADGSAWIVDGNHRLVDARQAGLPALDVVFTFAAPRKANARAKSLYGELPKSAPPPPPAPTHGEVVWETGAETGTFYATRGPLQVTVEYDPMSHWRRSDRGPDRPAPTFQVVLRVRAPESHTTLRYLYAEGLPRGEARKVAERVLHDTRGPLRVHVQNDLRGAFDAERDRRFGMFGTYVVPVSARARIVTEPILVSGRGLKRKPKRNSVIAAREGMPEHVTDDHWRDPDVETAIDIARLPAYGGRSKFLGTGNFGIGFRVETPDGPRLVKIAAPYNLWHQVWTREAQTKNLMQEAGIANEVRALGFSVIPETWYAEFGGGTPAVVREYGEPVTALAPLEYAEVERQLDAIERVHGWRVLDDLQLYRRPDGSVYVGDVGYWRAPTSAKSAEFVRSGLNGLLEKLQRQTLPGLAVGAGSAEPSLEYELRIPVATLPRMLDAARQAMLLREEQVHAPAKYRAHNAFKRTVAMQAMRYLVDGIPARERLGIPASASLRDAARIAEDVLAFDAEVGPSPKRNGRKRNSAIAQRTEDRRIPYVDTSRGYEETRDRYQTDIEPAHLTPGHWQEPDVIAARASIRDITRNYNRQLGQGNFGIGYRAETKARGVRFVKVAAATNLHGQPWSRGQQTQNILHEAGVANELRAKGYTVVPEGVYTEWGGGTPAWEREYGEPVTALTPEEYVELERQLTSIERDAHWRVADDLLLFRRPDGSIFVGDVGIWQTPMKHTRKWKWDNSGLRSLLEAVQQKFLPGLTTREEKHAPQPGYEWTARIPVTTLPLVFVDAERMRENLARLAAGERDPEDAFFYRKDAAELLRHIGDRDVVGLPRLPEVDRAEALARELLAATGGQSFDEKAEWARFKARPKRNHNSTDSMYARRHRP